MNNKDSQQPGSKAPVKEQGNSCSSSEQGAKESSVRAGRKSLIIPTGHNGKNKLRYVEGTKQLKDGCWLSDQ